MLVNLFLLAYAKQRTSNACIVKIEFGRFHQPLVEIAMIGLKAIEDIGTFQNRQPGPGCVGADAGIARQTGMV